MHSRLTHAHAPDLCVWKSREKRLTCRQGRVAGLELAGFDIDGDDPSLMIRLDPWPNLLIVQFATTSCVFLGSVPGFA
jgi:hypothetical protein